jgi:hypothetical protein
MTGHRLSVTLTSMTRNPIYGNEIAFTSAWPMQ